MKKIIFSLLIMLTLSALSYAQPGGRFGEGKARIESYRIAFLTEKLELTPEESQNFWPVYNEMREKLEALRDDRKDLGEIENMTDQEAETFMRKRFDMDQQRIDLMKTYYGKLRNVLPPRKIVRIKPAEDAFKRQLLQQVRKRRQGSGLRGDRF